MSATSVWEAPSGERLPGKGRRGVIAGNTVWSMPERLESEVLQKVRYINTLTFYFYLLYRIVSFLSNIAGKRFQLSLCNFQNNGTEVTL